MYVVVGLAAAIAAAAVVFVLRHHQRAARLVGARGEAAALTRHAKRGAAATQKNAERTAREQGLRVREAAENELAQQSEKLTRRAEKLAKRESALDDRARELDARREVVDEGFAEVKSLRDRAQGLRRDAKTRHQDMLAQLEERTGLERDQVVDKLGRRWIEAAQAEAAHRVRMAESSDAGTDQQASRLMSIGVSRYKNHFLTERNLSRIRVGERLIEKLTADDERMLNALAEVANVQLNVVEDGEHIRLEGLDGVGREVARRCLSKLIKKRSVLDEAKADPQAAFQKVRKNLEREILSLGKKAFNVLAIEKPHQEIVELVGALNYRTSYTQNQWLHAVEASFLCGMIAKEMGLDVKIARRATLMHDIGKALTHKIEGSHAVIGADIARRLGEDELVANAIGAHHLDEPMNSAYAFLVAAADAMSGARPGARREFTDDHSSKLSDLERIGRHHKGVDSAFAVHGGRELRVYVRENQVDDLGAVELSSNIAEQVADEMTFPGQIKVTVIRAYEAVSTAN